MAGMEEVQCSHRQSKECVTQHPMRSTESKISSEIQASFSGPWHSNIYRIAGAWIFWNTALKTSLRHAENTMTTDLYPTACWKIARMRAILL